MKALTEPYLTNNDIVNSLIITELLMTDITDVRTQYENLLKKLYDKLAPEEARLYFIDICNHSDKEVISELIPKRILTGDDINYDLITQAFLRESAYLEELKNYSNPDTLSLYNYFLYQQGLKEYKSLLEKNADTDHLVDTNSIVTSSSDKHSYNYRYVKDGNVLICLLNLNENDNEHILFSLRRICIGELGSPYSDYILEYLNPEFLDITLELIQTVDWLVPKESTVSIVSQPIDYDSSECFYLMELLSAYPDIFEIQECDIKAYLEYHLETYNFPKPEM